MGVSLFFFFTKYTKCNKNEGKKKYFSSLISLIPILLIFHEEKKI